MSTNYESNFSEDDDVMSKPPLDGEINEGSILEDLKSALAADVENEDLILRIPQRPILRARYKTFIDGDLFQHWQRRATIKNTQRIDVMKLSTTIIANQLAGLEVWNKQSKSWVEVHDSDGASLTIYSPMLKDMLVGDNPSTPTSLVRKLYSNDGHLLAASGEIAEAAGYGDEAADDSGIENPTLG